MLHDTLYFYLIVLNMIIIKSGLYDNLCNISILSHLYVPKGMDCISLLAHVSQIQSVWHFVGAE